MKTIYITFITAALGVAAFTSCSNTNDPEATSGMVSPDFTATIGSSSRAYDTSWEQGDKIGITGASRSNVCHLTTDGNGRFTAETPDTRIYFQDESDVTFTAYYPWNSLPEGATIINADTKNQTPSDQKSFDFLWAQASGKKDAPNVTFSFAHRMSKVAFTVRPGNGMSYDEVKAAALSLGGFHHGGTFNTADGSVAVNGVAADKWTFTGGISNVAYNDAQQAATYSFIVFPQAFNAPLDFVAELDLPGERSYHLRTSIDFTAANKEKDNGEAQNEWVAGRQYNINLILHKTDISVEKSTIVPWEPVKGDEIIVD